MNTQLAREALLKIAAGMTELALSFGETDQPAARAGDAVSVPTPAEGAAVAPPAAAPPPHLGPVSNRTPPPTESAFTECPAHHKAWTDGNFGPYCTAPSEDPSPDWTNAKGYCRITPKNAGAWLRKHGRAA